MPAAKVVAAEISMRVLLKCSDMGGAASGTVPKAAIGRRLVAQLLSGINEGRIPEVVKLSDTLPAGHVKDAAQRLITLDDMDPRARAGARGRRRLFSRPGLTRHGVDGRVRRRIQEPFQGRADLQGIGRIAAPRVHHAARLPHVQSASRQPREGAPRGAGARHPRDPPGFPHGRVRIREDACPADRPGLGSGRNRTPPGRWNAACFPRLARSAAPVATPWPRASTARTRPSSSGDASPSRI